MLYGALLQDRLLTFHNDIGAHTLHTIRSIAFSAWLSPLTPLSNRSTQQQRYRLLCAALPRQPQKADKVVLRIHCSQKSHLQGLLYPVADDGELCMVLGILQKIIRQPEVLLYISCSSCSNSVKVNDMCCLQCHRAKKLVARSCMRTAADQSALCRVQLCRLQCTCHDGATNNCMAIGGFCHSSYREGRGAGLLPQLRWQRCLRSWNTAAQASSPGMRSRQAAAGKTGMLWDPSPARKGTASACSRSHLSPPGNGFLEADEPQMDHMNHHCAHTPRLNI